MFKYAFCLVVLLCCTQWGTALPRSNFGADILNESSKTKLEQSFSNMISSVADFSSTLKSTVIDSILIAPARLLIAINMRMEFYTMATGNHFSVLTSKDANHLKIAAFVAEKCLSQLERMEEADEILNSATKDAAELFIRGKSDKSEAIVPVFEKFESYIKSDPKLNAEFHNFEYNNDLQEHKVFLPQEEAFHVAKRQVAIEKWLSDEKIRKILLHRYFLLNGHSKFTVLFKGDDYEKLILVKSVLSVAHKPETKKLAQKLYDEAILEITQKFNPMYDPEVADQLFDNLEQKFSTATELNTKFVQVKKDIKNNLISIDAIMNIESWLPF